MSEAYPTLFSPVELHGVPLRNRIVHASMTTKMGREQKITEPLLNYYRNRAQGGAGLIVTEPLAVQPWHGQYYKVDVFEDGAGIKRWATDIEQHDCRLIGQLQDSGRGRHEEGKHPFAIAPSALPDDLSWTVPRALTDEAIEALVERFVEATMRLQDAGFSGVEISAGHGHLFHQFLSPWSNLREDRWGGSVENRTRIVRELGQRIRERCGARFIIGLKLPGDDGIAGSVDVTEAARFTAQLALPDVFSYFCHAQGSHSPWLETHVPDMHGPRVPYTSITQAMREPAGDVPLMALGLITDPAEGERLLADGDAELIGLGRPLVTDPSWPNKSRDGRAAEIRYCVSCNTCWATIIRDGQPIACDNNPRVGETHEADWWPEAVTAQKRIVVVGGGVAGMEAAWVASARGHDVTVLGRGEQVGGKTWLQAQLPGGENLSSVYDYQLYAAQRAGVDVQIAGFATADDVLALKPDHVVLATGATMIWPRELPEALRDEGFVLDLRLLMVDMLDYSEAQGGTAVILDHDHTHGTYMAAEHLRTLFDRVVLLTPRETVAQFEALVVRQGIYRRLNEQGIEVMPFTQFGDMAALEEGAVMARNIYTGNETRIEDIALISYSTPRRQDDGLYEPLVAAGLSVERVGDCRTPDRLLAATQSGHELGNTL
ncbi:MAG: FAD-dependent oxidoreductase [Gammaproteobacteria bacterium]